MKGRVSLQRWAIGGLMLATVSVGMIGFMSQGLQLHGVSENVDTGELTELEKVSNATALSQTAQDRANDIKTKSNLFILPSIISLFKLPLDAIPLWETFITVTVQTLGIQSANWLVSLGLGSIMIMVAFGIGRILR